MAVLVTTLTPDTRWPVKLNSASPLPTAPSDDIAGTEPLHPFPRLGSCLPTCLLAMPPSSRLLSGTSRRANAVGLSIF